MGTLKSKEKKPTTVSVDMAIRDFINQEADRLGLSQRQMVSRLWETFKLQQEKSRSPDKLDTDAIVEGIYGALEKVLKRDDRIIAFIKEQEKLFLNPLLNNSQSNTETLKQLVEVLSNLE